MNKYLANTRNVQREIKRLKKKKKTQKLNPENLQKCAFLLPMCDAKTFQIKCTFRSFPNWRLYYTFHNTK